MALTIKLCRPDVTEDVEQQSKRSATRSNFKTCVNIRLEPTSQRVQSETCIVYADILSRRTQYWILSHSKPDHFDHSAATPTWKIYDCEPRTFRMYFDYIYSTAPTDIWALAKDIVAEDPIDTDLCQATNAVELLFHASILGHQIYDLHFCNEIMGLLLDRENAPVQQAVGNTVVSIVEIVDEACSKQCVLTSWLIDTSINLEGVCEPEDLPQKIMYSVTSKLISDKAAKMDSERPYLSKEKYFVKSNGQCGSW